MCGGCGRLGRPCSACPSCGGPVEPSDGSLVLFFGEWRTPEEIEAMEVEQRRASSEWDAARFLDEMQPWVEHEQQRQQQVEPPPPPLDETSAPIDGELHRLQDEQAGPPPFDETSAPADGALHRLQDEQAGEHDHESADLATGTQNEPGEERQSAGAITPASSDELDASLPVANSQGSESGLRRSGRSSHAGVDYREAGVPRGRSGGRRGGGRDESHGRV